MQHEAISETSPEPAPEQIPQSNSGVQNTTVQAADEIYTASDAADQPLEEEGTGSVKKKVIKKKVIRRVVKKTNT